ncbi:MAG: HNH endonuclease [Gemmataceae bacterium]
MTPDAIALRRIFERDYAEYRRSHHWQHLRAVMLELSGHACEQCGNRSLLQVHHRHYRTVGWEVPSDLAVLCRACHAAAHGLPAWEKRNEERAETVQDQLRRLHGEAERERHWLRKRRRGA